MSSTQSKVKTISEDTGLSKQQVTKVLFSYLSWCLQEVLIDGESRTIFGTLKLNEDNRLELQHDKEGLISLLSLSDIKMLTKVCEEGPDFEIFQ